MSLATRCTACSTVFRVVQDQLKVSEGWVRCGRCNEVFNAFEGLFDLQRETPPDWPSTLSPPSAASVQEPQPASAAVIEVAQPASDERVDPRIDAQLLGPRRSESGSTPATRISERDRLEFPDAQFDPESVMDDAQAPDADAASPAALEAAHSAAPEFIRRAQRQARWQQPLMRAALGAAALALTAALVLQGGHHFRDLIAARWPAAKPALVAWCALVSCSIEAPRRIEDVSVESTALTRASIPDAFRFSVALRNRGTMTVALPAVDLSLTDAAGQLVARRMLMPRDFRVASALLPPGAESALQLTLSAGDARITGYTVEIFYP